MILRLWFSEAANSTCRSRMLHDCKCTYDSVLFSETVKCFSPHSDFSTSLLVLGQCSQHFSIDPFMFKKQGHCNHGIVNSIPLRVFSIFTKRTLTLHFLACSSNETAITYHQNVNVMEDIMNRMNSTHKVSWFFCVMCIINPTVGVYHSTWRRMHVFTYVPSTDLWDYMQHSLKTWLTRCGQGRELFLFRLLTDKLL